MRGVTAAIIAGAALLVIVIAVLIRTEDAAPPAPAPSVRRATGAGQAAGAPDKPLSRSARVEDRLNQLRADYNKRQVGATQPEANKREVPEGALRQAEAPPIGMGDEDEEEDPEEMEELRKTLFDDPDPDERIGAVLMLTGSDSPEALRMLIDAMDDPDPEVRLSVVEALGDHTEDLSPDILTPALRDPDAEVRFEAVSVLGDIESPDALRMVQGAMNDPDGDVRALAEGILDFAEGDTPGAAKAR